MIGKKITHEGSYNKYPWLLRPWIIFFWPRQLRLPLVQPLMSHPPYLGSCFNWVLSFSMLRASTDLPWLLGGYVLIIHTSLGLHPESNWRLLIDSNYLSLYWGTRIRNLHLFKFIDMEYWKYLLNLWGNVITWK